MADASLRISMVSDSYVGSIRNYVSQVEEGKETIEYWSEPAQPASVPSLAM
jgi:hypothetical protein